jgi:hypothetical protein
MVAPLINPKARRGQPRALRYSIATARPVQKISCRRREIAACTSRNRRNGEKDSDVGNKTGRIMTIAEYLAATALIALIVWAVLGLLMQES